jgi:hypothetical protein
MYIPLPFLFGAISRIIHFDLRMNAATAEGSGALRDSLLHRVSSGIRVSFALLQIADNCR